MLFRSDIIHVENGSYGLVRNVVLGTQDSGVRIEGPAVGVAVVNRGNTNSGSDVVELAGGDDVTLSRLTLTGGQYGVYASSSADSDRLRIENCVVTSNYSGNVFLASSNDQSAIVQTKISRSYYGIYTGGSNTSVVGCEIFGNNSWSVFMSAAGGLVQDNQVYNNSHGMSVGGNGTQVTGNLVHHNTYYEIGRAHV